MKNIQSEILLKQLKIVNDNLKLTIMSSFVMLLAIAYQFNEEFDFVTVIIWFFISGFALIFRIYLFLIQKTFPLNRNNLSSWHKLVFVNTALSSIAYAVASVSTYFMVNELHVMCMYIILAGVSAGAVTAYGSVKNLSDVFIFPLVIPLVIINLITGDVNHYILAFILSLFVYIVLSASKNSYRTFLNTLEQGITIRNLTEEKVRMEEMAKLKSDFFASMSHEIRTPLNGIVGLVDLLLLKEVEEKEEHDYLETIKKSSDDLLNVINDVLDLSKIESGKLELLPKKTNIASFGNRMMLLFSQQAKSKNISLKLNLDQDLPNLVYIDEHRLSQVVTNILSNAIKFTNEGSVRLSINVLKRSRHDVKLQFKIEDTGIGIATDKLKLIFNKYDQIANATDYLITQKGTGLGLSIAKKIVTLMEGRIGVHSTEKEGSSFWFTVELPIAEKSTEVKKTLTSENENKFNLNVLLVDDRVINLKVATLMLKNLGCKVDTATNGEIAITKYDRNSEKYDLIIMDIQMPIMDGLTATNKLREKYPNDLSPIYGLSAQVSENLHKSPEELGFDFYLTKPLSLETLKNSLKRLTDIG